MLWRGMLPGPAVAPAGTIDRGDPLARGLVGWWPLQDGKGGTARDLSGRGIHGTLTGSKTWTRHPRGTAFQFGASSTQGFDLGLRPAMEVDYLTACAWICMTGSSAYLSWLGRRGGSTQTWTFSVDNTAKLYSIMWNSGGSLAVANSAAALTTGVWYHIAVTYDGVTVRNFINGAPDGTAALAGVAQKSAAEHPWIGYSAWENNSFPGHVWDVRFYNRALAQPEIGQIMRAPWRPWQFHGFASANTALAPIVATLAATLADLTATATGTVRVAAQVAAQLDGIGLPAAATARVAATLAATLEDLAATAAATVLTHGAVIATLADVLAEATGRVLVTGVVAATLDDLAVLATAGNPPTPARMLAVAAALRVVTASPGAALVAPAAPGRVFTA